MAVLVEGISVIIKAQAIIDRYPGGWEAFEANPPNATLCADNELIRVGFMTPVDAKGFVERLASHGIEYLRDGKAIDLVVADQQRGLAAPCEWAEFGRLDWEGDSEKRVAACRLVGSRYGQVLTPDGWSYDGSLSARFGFVPSGWESEFLDRLSHKDGLDVYRDIETGKEVYVGRTGAQPDAPGNG